MKRRGRRRRRRRDSTDFLTMLRSTLCKRNSSPVRENAREGERRWGGGERERERERERGSIDPVQGFMHPCIYPSIVVPLSFRYSTLVSVFLLLFLFLLLLLLLLLLLFQTISGGREEERERMRGRMRERKRGKVGGKVLSVYLPALSIYHGALLRFLSLSLFLFRRRINTGNGGRIYRSTRTSDEIGPTALHHNQPIHDENTHTHTHHTHTDTHTLTHTGTGPYSFALKSISNDNGNLAVFFCRCYYC